MPIWVMKRIPWPVITVAIHVMAAIRRGAKLHGESVISIPRDRNAQFEPIAALKHESRGLSI